MTGGAAEEEAAKAAEGGAAAGVEVEEVEGVERCCGEKRFGKGGAGAEPRLPACVPPPRAVDDEDDRVRPILAASPYIHAPVIV